MQKSRRKSVFPTSHIFAPHAQADKRKSHPSARSLAYRRIQSHDMKISSMAHTPFLQTANLPASRPHDGKGRFASPSTRALQSSFFFGAVLCAHFVARIRTPARLCAHFVARIRRASLCHAYARFVRFMFQFRRFVHRLCAQLKFYASSFERRNDMDALISRCLGIRDVILERSPDDII